MNIKMDYSMRKVFASIIYSDQRFDSISRIFRTIVWTNICLPSGYSKRNICYYLIIEMLKSCFCWFFIFFHLFSFFFYFLHSRLKGSVSLLGKSFYFFLCNFYPKFYLFFAILASTHPTKKIAITRYTYICCEIPGNKKYRDKI